jgi:hypothetical protein
MKKWADQPAAPATTIIRRNYQLNNRLSGILPYEIHPSLREKGVEKQRN